MLHVVQSNKMENLAESLISCLQQSAGQGVSVFESEQILVQSPGMSQWLKIQIAENMGIAANIEFPLPSSFIWQLYQQHIDDLPKQSAFTKANMTWKLMTILPSMLSLEEFSPIQDYLADIQLSANTPLKLYQLAGNIADVYDQYLVYRPDWIIHWEAGNDDLPEPIGGSDNHNWQAMLWRALVDYSKTLQESPFHRANLHQTLLTQLFELPPANPTNIAPKPLLVFGISAMPWQQLEVLNALAQTQDVVIFWFNPSQHYWGDLVDSKTQAKVKLKADEQAFYSSSKAELASSEFLDVGNPLLSAWGKLGRDYQDMLLSLDVQQQDDFIEQAPVNLLQHIQSEVANLEYRGTNQALDANELLSNGDLFPKIEIDGNDQSLQVHVCHSKVRELEALYDQLLHVFNQNPDWHPGDVIVMMPDVAAYAPFIDGVFGSKPSQQSIPFAISDRNLAQVSVVINSFVSLMSLHQSRLTLSDMLSLLEVPAIQRRFELSLQEFERLKHWLFDAGVRWGWDGDDKLRWQLPSEAQNTWIFGLKRLLAGYAMAAGYVYQTEQELIAPYADIEGQDAEALGKLYQFTLLLLEALAFCQQAQSIQQKVDIALSFVSHFYVPDEKEQAELVVIRETLEGLLTHKTQYPGAIEQDIFVAELQQNIQEKGVGQRFLAGYVNFCTLMPMRSIPFKMVCLLGMNDSDYPRQTVPLGFDLIRFTQGRKGDRSRRLDDRYLFLEAVLSARDMLYFSYQGISQKDNAELAPSILLSELIEYCQQGFCLRGDLALPVETTEKNLLKNLHMTHGVHAFNAEYFETKEYQGATTQSFDPQALAIAKQLTLPMTEQIFCPAPLLCHSNSEAKDESEQQAELGIDLLKKFFHNPAKDFFVRRWQTQFFNLAEQNTDEEPFVFDGLDKYQLNDSLIEELLLNAFYINDGDQNQSPNGHAEFDQSSVISRLKAQGKLPVGNTAELAINPLLQQSATLVKQIQELIPPTDGLTINQIKQSITLDLAFEGVRLNGRIDNVFGKRLVLWRAAKLRAKDRISLYLNWLALCVALPHTKLDSAHFVCVDKTYSLSVIEHAQAISQLQMWVEYWVKGEFQPIHFYAESAWEWVNSQNQNKTLSAFMGSDYVKGEGQDSHIQRVCPNLASHFDAFSQIAEQLLRPLFELEYQPEESA